MHYQKFHYRQKSIWKPLAYALNFLSDVVWRLTLGLKPTILYLFCVGNEQDKKLAKDGLKIIESNPDFIKFSNWLRDNISEDLIKSETKKMRQSNANANFTSDLTRHLDETTKLKILNFALDEKNIRSVSNYLKFVPILDSITVMLNIPTGAEPSGSQKWHRDWFNYKGMNIFIALTDINDETGVYSAVGLGTIPRRAEIPSFENENEFDAYNKGRISDASLLQFVNEESIERLEGASGTTAFVDSGWVYHKGGHLKRDYRLMLQIAYRSQEKPNEAKSENILNQLNLAGHKDVNNILSDRVRNYMVFGDSEQKKIGWVFHWLSRKFTYYKKRLHS